MTAGEIVVLYGQVIGETSCNVAAGEHVHEHNLVMTQRRLENPSNSLANRPLFDDQPLTFDGYHREGGSVGTRNYVGIVSTVNCSGSVSKFIAEAAERQGFLEDFPNVDGIIPIVHGTGCGMSRSDEGFEVLMRTLAGYARNPNFGGVLVVGLGCEVLQVAQLIEAGSFGRRDSLQYMTIQAEGGTSRTIARGIDALKKVAEVADRATRRPAPISKLVLGMQCGGSDGYSGMTANPALGYASDLIVQHGGTTILSETPEIYGAEHLLVSRARSAEVAEALESRIAWWEDYCERNLGEMNNNPSPGNKRGGLTTILEKSLGAVSKSGTAPLAAVYRYAEQIDTTGLVFVDTPGFDPVSVAGQVASGANMIAFTTGRGSVSGFKPVPSLKLATNSDLYGRMEGDMDINCGDIVDQGVAIEAKGEEIFRRIIEAASGKKTKSEKLGFGGAEFVPWHIGAVM